MFEGHFESIDKEFIVSIVERDSALDLDTWVDVIVDGGGGTYIFGSGEILIVVGSSLDILVHEYLECVNDFFRFPLSHKQLSDIADNLTEVIKWYLRENVNIIGVKNDNSLL